MTQAMKQDVTVLRSRYRKAFVRWHRARGEAWSYRWYAVVERYSTALLRARGVPVRVSA